MLTSWQTFFKTLASFSTQDINRCFFLQILLKMQIKFIEQYVLRIIAFLEFSLNQKFSYFVFEQRKSHFFKFTFALAASFPIKYTTEYSSRFVLCCFVITVNWSLLKQQDLDTVIIIKISCDNTTENCFFQVLSYFQCLMYQIPLRRLLGKQNIKTKEFMW